MNTDSVNPFNLKDCTLATLATGQRAGSLIELRDKVATIDQDSIYYHFWAGHLHSPLVHPEDQNDFASWVHHFLHEHSLAERLAVLDPTAYPNIEELRAEILNILEEGIEEREMIIWTKKEQQFHFIRSKIVVFDTAFIIHDPSELLHLIPNMSTGSIFYHFIDARHRTDESVDDFTSWLRNYGDKYNEIIHQIKSIDIYFLSLAEIRKSLGEIMSKFFISSVT